MDYNYMERIKKAKADQKMTNETLAELTGIPGSTLSKILAGFFTDSPKFVNVIAIAEALKMPYGYLIDGDTADNRTNLDEDEQDLISSYRQLDAHGKSVLNAVLELEIERISSDHKSTAPIVTKVEDNKILPPIQPDVKTALGKRKVPYYSDLRTSAGSGQYLTEGEGTVETITIPDVDKTKDADFVIMISGNSMEPRFHSGDYIMVQSCDSVEPGEFGLFVADGESFFKVFGGDKLISLNPDYAPILLNQFTEVHCYGRVVGKLKKR